MILNKKFKNRIMGGGGDFDDNVTSLSRDDRYYNSNANGRSYARDIGGGHDRVSFLRDIGSSMGLDYNPTAEWLELSKSKKNQYHTAYSDSEKRKRNEPQQHEEEVEEEYEDDYSDDSQQQQSRPVVKPLPRMYATARPTMSPPPDANLPRYDHLFDDASSVSSHGTNRSSLSNASFSSLRRPQHNDTRPQIPATDDFRRPYNQIPKTGRPKKNSRVVPHQQQQPTESNFFNAPQYAPGHSDEEEGGEDIGYHPQQQPLQSGDAGYNIESEILAKLGPYDHGAYCFGCDDEDDLAKLGDSLQQIEMYIDEFKDKSLSGKASYPESCKTLSKKYMKVLEKHNKQTDESVENPNERNEYYMKPWTGRTICEHWRKHTKDSKVAALFSLADYDMIRSNLLPHQMITQSDPINGTSSSPNYDAAKLLIAVNAMSQKVYQTKLVKGGTLLDEKSSGAPSKLHVPKGHNSQGVKFKGVSMLSSGGGF
jgi:hypothetical protein